ncbi:L,D-transpeptidase family protein [Raineyella sp. LH-20]|uniref:L,D-transpeptidase family protein n=1 Tax=Raineyella sp. LH-20 TaxID=3081204 RepID=UPI0029541795|nr:L,D-transpeptidase family protein [Raineyella sp. LH-20]WOP18154.1 L,D-transpeptidase family protein [Raineyella sp. LH-20]
MGIAARARAALATVAVAALLVTGCTPSRTASPGATAEPTATASALSPSPSPSASAPTPSPTPTGATPSPRPTAGPAILERGDSGQQVRDLQARLKQIGWFSGSVTGYYGDATVTAVKGFQTKRGLPVTGAVDQTTQDRLRAMTHTPTAAELADSSSGRGTSTAGLDPRCLTGRAICISKSTRKLVWVVDGQPQLRMDVRFGSELTPTREGSFQVEWKSRDWVSTLYHTPMPYSMFFSGGQAVHYSSDFAARGYNGSSHGCVNVRDYNGIATLYSQVRVGDKVIVYR